MPYSRNVANLKMMQIICILISFYSTRAFFMNNNRAFNQIKSMSMKTEGNTFRELYFDYLPSWLLDKCESVGFVTATPVQESVLPVSCIIHSYKYLMCLFLLFFVDCI